MPTITAEPLAPGTILKERYEIIRLIKGGGMAWLYQVREHRRDGTTGLWALKELRADADDNHTLEEARQLFEQEAHILVRLSHPNLPRVSAYFHENGRAYLVMEFIHGETLQDRLEQANAPMLQSQVVRWAIQICDVLHYLHTRPQPVIFRDMKPSNVMVTPDGQIKLIDFGIARTYKAGKRRDTITMGSENYAAPEQWGQGQTDPRSDIYGLGATLYHLLTNVAPLPAYVPGERAPITQHNPAVTQEVVAVVEKAMAQDRGARYHSAAEMREALLHCLPPWERLRLATRPREAAPPAQAAATTAQQEPEARSVEKRVPPAPTKRPGTVQTSETRYCAQCGASNRAEARYCRTCGRRMRGQQARAQTAQLSLMGQNGQKIRFSLPEGETLIGRRGGKRPVDLDLGTYDPNGYVSRNHVRIIVKNGTYQIEDLYSSNGTYVNGQRLAVGRLVRLQIGDEIRMGRLELRVEGR